MLDICVTKMLAICVTKMLAICVTHLNWPAALDYFGAQKDTWTKGMGFAPG